MTNKVFALWLTGLPVSGKTTLARLLERELVNRGIQVQVLDSDELRGVLTPEPNYTHDERLWFYKSLAYIGGLLVNNDVNSVIAATAHREVYRSGAREYLPDLLEIYVHCPVHLCMQRDTKGIYDLAMQKGTDSFPGINELYEEPEMPFLRVDSEKFSPQENVEIVIEKLLDAGIIGNQK